METGRSMTDEELDAIEKRAEEFRELTMRWDFVTAMERLRAAHADREHLVAEVRRQRAAQVWLIAEVRRLQDGHARLAEIVRECDRLNRG